MKIHGKLHALLIGIDQYIPPSIPGEIDYPPLEGAVGDVRRVRSFLLELPTSLARILELTASSGDGPEPVESRECWPTYEVMVSKFRELAAGAESGDQVYIYYSGHGGRVPTIFPEEKGVNGLDETLVPCNVANTPARHLRDVELAMLVQEMVDKGLLVTVVLDCCHSGGMRRRGPRKPTPSRPIPRGVETPDRRPRSTDSLVGTREQLAAFLRPTPTALPGMRTFRHTRLDGGLVEPRGYVMFAACRPQEKAFEYAFDGQESQGALTYYLLSALREGGAEATWLEVESVVSPRVHARFPDQAPMLYGEKGRRFLGGVADGENKPPERDGSAGVSILAVQGSWVLLNAGEVEGLREGMRFAIYPPALDRQLAGKRLAEVEIRKVGAAESWAAVVKAHFRTALREGGKAAPLGGAAVGRPALCAIANGETSPVVDRTATLARVRGAIGNDGSGAVKIAEEGEPADFQVSVNERGEYEIWDATDRPLVNLGPVLSVVAAAAEAELLRRLIHLAMYRDVEQLENEFTERSSVKGKLHLKPLHIEAPTLPGGGPRQRPLSQLADAIELRCGERLILEIENQSPLALNVVVLDLQPDWGIAQIFPARHDAEFWPLDPGEKKNICIGGYLPEGCEESRDVIKAFATLGVPSFLWREMPPLNKPVARPRLTRTFRGDVPDEVSNSSPLVVGDFAGRDWTTAQIEVRVRRDR
jgi:Caspase domain